MEYLRCEIFADEPERAVRFYRDVLGFHVERDDRDATGYVSMRRGAVVLGVGRGSALESTVARRPPMGVELVLVVDDVLAARDRVVAYGWPLDEDLVSRPWGLSDFRVLDPDGYYWRVTEESPHPA